jgi:large subunit ribosomal protein L3
MTHVIATDSYEPSPSYGQQISRPVTVVECPPLFIFGLRAYKKTPYGLKAFSDVLADNLSKELLRVLRAVKKHKREESIKKIEAKLADIAELRAMTHAQPKKIKLKKTPEIFEIPIAGKDINESWKWGIEHLGKEVAMAEVFAEGDMADAIAITTGKGTQGPVARWGVKIQVRKAHGHRRFPGSIGAWHPARVIWTVPMMGQMGFQQRTEINKRILKIADNGKDVTPKGGFVNYGEVSGAYALIDGSLPGPKKRLVMLRHAMREEKKKPALPILSISTRSQQ